MAASTHAGQPEVAASRMPRPSSVTHARVAALALFALALLLLAHWRLYRVPRVECVEPVPRAGGAPSPEAPCEGGAQEERAALDERSRAAAPASVIVAAWSEGGDATRPAATPLRAALQEATVADIRRDSEKIRANLRSNNPLTRARGVRQIESVLEAIGFTEREIAAARTPDAKFGLLERRIAEAATSATSKERLNRIHKAVRRAVGVPDLPFTPTPTPWPTPQPTPQSTPKPTPTATGTPAPTPTPRIDPSESPTPSPTPAASPTPTPHTSPTPEASPSPGGSPSVTPTPGASPAATPGASPAATPTTAEHGRISVNRPERFLEGQEDSISCELARVLEEVVASESRGNGTVTTVEGVVLDIFDPRYTPEAMFVFESAHLQLTGGGTGTRTPPGEERGWKSLADGGARWDWQVRLRDASRERISFTLRLHVRMLPKEAGESVVVMRNVWSRRFDDIPTGLPANVLAAQYGSPVSFAGGLALLGVYGLPGRRRRLEKELAREVRAHYREASYEGAPAGGATAQQDEVQFSVYSPPSAAPADSFLVQVFAHLASQLSELAARAAEADPEAGKHGTATIKKPVTRGTELTVSLRMDDLVVDEPSQTFTWRGEVEQAQFIVTVPEGRRSGSLVGVVTVLQESVPIGHLKFAFRVAPAAGPTQPAAPAPVPADFVRYKRAFISYASEDRAEVLKRVQMLDRLGVPYFQDLLSLEPGQRWEPLLYRYIDESDVFYLFWSSAAKRSKWVRKEVQYALRRQSESHAPPPEIVPVIIEGPPPVAPPRYLAALHFNDKFLYFIDKEVDSSQ